MSFSEIKAKYDANVIPTYARQDVCFVRGSGSRLWDSEGKEYIDFASGIGVNSVGYAHPEWVATVAAQAGILAHTSNLYYSEPGGELAQKLCELSGMKKVFFANSGAEANEGLIKLARKYSANRYPGQNRQTVVTLRRSFHGRTHTTLAATGQDVFHQHFQPLTSGFIHVEPGDFDALLKLPDDVCAIMIEPVQGEGGVFPCPIEYIRAVASLCADKDWLFLMDEVQTGVGRCGSWFAYQSAGVRPDALSFAKGIAGGLPMGGFLISDKCEGVLNPGQHATTFGGSPLVCSAALATIDILEKEIDKISVKGDYIRNKIEGFGLSTVRGTRGAGLMIGVSVDGDPKAWVKALLAEGLVALTAGTDAVRMLPPLVITRGEIDAGLEIFQKVLQRGI